MRPPARRRGSRSGSCAPRRDGTTRRSSSCARPIEILRATDFRRSEIEPLTALAGFLRERGRDEDAQRVSEELAALTGEPAVSPST